MKMIKFKYFLFIILANVSLSNMLFAAYRRKNSDAYQLNVATKQEQPTTQTKKTPASTLPDFLDEKDRVKKLSEMSLILNPMPIPSSINPDDVVSMNLENTDLQSIVLWASENFNIDFISEESIQPLLQGSKTVTGNKITFHTQKILSKKEAWELFLKFLDIFGLTLTQGPSASTYRIKITEPDKAQSVNKSALPVYINVSLDQIPTDDGRIRYIYFIQNSTLGTLQPILDNFRSNTGTLHALEKLNAFILTDKASNIHALIRIIKDLDQVTSPEAMSVLKLKNTDAEAVKALYEELSKEEDPQKLTARLLGAKKAPTTVYFSSSIKLIAEPRTNTLIILGSKEGIKKVEDFIIKHVDVELEIPYSPLYVYELQYVSAEAMEQLLNEVTRFAPNSPASISGGVRQGDKYLQPMVFKAEPAGNRLLIKAEKEDYLKVREIIKELDVKQPQVVVEVLIVNVLSNDNKELGVQIRNKTTGTVSKNLDYQTSGFFLDNSVPASPVVDSTTGSIVANLINLAQSQSTGKVLLSISGPTNGVWGMFGVLQSLVHTNIIANPFLIATNKYQAQVSIGETRRVITAQVVGVETTDARGDVSASLTIRITPQINKLGVINLDIAIDIDTFTDATDQNNADKNVKTIRTNASLGNREVLAVGGLLKTNKDEIVTKVPLLGDIPIVGWLFKNKSKIIRRDNLLIFISPRIVEPLVEGGATKHTTMKAAQAKNDLCMGVTPPIGRDPIHRFFFKDNKTESTRLVDSFLNKTHAFEAIQTADTIDCNTVCNFGEPLPDREPQSVILNAKPFEQKTSPVNPVPKNKSNASPERPQECQSVFTCQQEKKKSSLMSMLPTSEEGVCT